MFKQANHPLEIRGNRLILHIRVTPKAARARLGGVQADISGRQRLKVAVTAPPDGGKANQAAIKALARACALPPSRLSIVAGAADRNKQVEIETSGNGTPVNEARSEEASTLQARIEALVTAPPA